MFNGTGSAGTSVYRHVVKAAAAAAASDVEVASCTQSARLYTIQVVSRGQRPHGSLSNIVVDSPSPPRKHKHCILYLAT
jgi:UDP-N-acetylmuramoylalanine-D-glutamate ligase